MDTKMNLRSKNDRYFKLSLKKNKLKNVEDSTISDVIILDESCDKLELGFQKNLTPKAVTAPPIVIDDSCVLSDDDIPKISLAEDPSKCGNVSFNCSRDSLSPTKESQPSIGGWSPAQHIITAKPRHDPVPTTPKDVANESYEHCSMKTIQQSQKKILSDLYGDAWKSIPKLFKTISHKYENFDGVTKRLFDDDDDEEKENIRHHLQKNKQLYLTSSDVKRNETNFMEINFNTEKKSKKKLYTEKVPNTPDVKKNTAKIRNANSTTKKVTKKGMSVTELVEVMKNDAANLKCKVDTNILTNNIDILLKTPKTIDDRKKKFDNLKENVSVTPNNNIQRLSFMASLADNVPSWRCHPEAIMYRDSYKTLREQLTRRLFVEFNKNVFDGAMDADMPIVWDGKLRSTAGTTTNRLVKNAKGDRIRTSSIKLSSKVVDAPQRLRDTLIHELCHAATWLIDAELRAGHGPLWKKWATRAVRVYPELGVISRCHDMEIHFKYSYTCVKCGYSIHRHSKSIDILRKCCGHCHGTFQLVINKKNKDGVVVPRPAKKGATNEFAQYVKENYASTKDGSKTHAEVMKLLGEQFSAKKTKRITNNLSSCQAQTKLLTNNLSCQATQAHTTKNKNGEVFEPNVFNSVQNCVRNWMS